MSLNYLAELRIVSFNFAPRGWALANGQLLPIAQNQALFSLLGTTFGGNGNDNFALPDLRARSPMHVGNGHVLGERGGAEVVTYQTMPVAIPSATSGASPASVPRTPTTTGETLSPFLGLNFIIALAGYFPSQN